MESVQQLFVAPHVDHVWETHRGLVRWMFRGVHPEGRPRYLW